MSKEPINVMIATPAYGGQVFTTYMKSVLEVIQEGKKYNINFAPYAIGNESLITRGRNACVAKFLSTPNIKYLFFVDADILFKPTDAVKLVMLAEVYKYEIIGGIYPKKAYDWSRLDDLNELLKMKKHIDPDNKQKMSDYIKDQLIMYNFNPLEMQAQGTILKVKHLATGFMLINRSVFPKLMKAYPEMKYNDHGGYEGNDPDSFYNFFDVGIDREDQDMYLSEDWYFCKICRKIGIDIYADVSVSLGHTGTHVFVSNLMNIMMKTKK